MKIVSNTSPIINLAAIEQLHLLLQLYERIIIPVAVYNEIVVQGAGQPGATEVQNELWFEQRIVMSPILVTDLLASNLLLNHAEAEAIIVSGKPLMDDLISIARFYIARPVYDQVLRVTGE